MAITSSCNASVLHVTPDHLVLTLEKGFVEARHLVPGTDVVFSDTALKTRCLVSNAQFAPRKALFFGLNCLDDSIVIANGIVVSAFGTFHRGPALWIRISSRILGLRVASRVGEFFASLYFLTQE